MSRRKLQNPVNNRRRVFAVGLAFCVVAFVAPACTGRSAPPAADAIANGEHYSSDNQVEVYGRHRCAICRNFVAQLEVRRLRYRFYDLDQKPNRKAEMWDLIREYHPETESVGLPVVRVNGVVLIQPAFENFKSYLNRVR